MQLGEVITTREQLLKCQFIAIPIFWKGEDFVSLDDYSFYLSCSLDLGAHFYADVDQYGDGQTRLRDKVYVENIPNVLHDNRICGFGMEVTFNKFEEWQRQFFKGNPNSPLLNTKRVVAVSCDKKGKIKGNIRELLMYSPGEGI